MPQPKLKSENYQNFKGINSKVSPYNTGPMEFRDIVNFDFTTPGSLTKREGFTQFIGATVTGRITGLHEFSRLDGNSRIIVSANTNLFFEDSGALTSFKTGLLDSAIFDFVTFVDRLFACNGDDFFKYDLTTVTEYSLPQGTGLDASLIGTGSAFTGIFTYSYGYLNDRGYAGIAGAETLGAVGLTVSVAGHSAVILGGFTTPADFGITALPIYRTSPNGVDQFRIGFADAGASLFTDNNLALGTAPPPDTIHFTLNPRYLEVYNNALMNVGFSSLPSTFYFSEPGEPERVKLANFIEVRTNDGDRLTGAKVYGDQLMLMKERSFHALSGDSSANYVLREISNEYGALSNRALVTWEDRFWFLDRKGICEYNGANVKIVSNKVESVFLGMNIDAAKDNAVGLHARLRNEVWFGIPTGGASLINTVVVYDYLADAWTTFKGIESSSILYPKASFDTETVLFGSYSGALFNFGSSLFGDNGAAMTCIIDTRFLTSNSQSIESQFRRLYLNTNEVSGLTSAITVDLFANFDGSTIQASRTMYQDKFQNRIDFGISSKSLAARFSNNTATDPIVIHGFTIESRKQRET